jgi:hypothetical protein
MDEIIIKSGPLKGKRIEFAPTSRVDLYRDVADEFMTRIFGMDAGDCLISDESAIGDFMGLNELDSVEAVKAKIQEVYGCVPTSVLFVDIFQQIRGLRP